MPPAAGRSVRSTRSPSPSWCGCRILSDIWRTRTICIMLATGLSLSSTDVWSTATCVARRGAHPAKRLTARRRGGTCAHRRTRLLGPGSRFTPELVESYLRTGAWREIPLGEYLEDAADAWPSAVAALTIDPATGHATAQMTYGEMRAMTRRVAAD